MMELCKLEGRLIVIFVLIFLSDVPNMEAFRIEEESRKETKKMRKRKTSKEKKIKKIT